MTNVPYSVATL